MASEALVLPTHCAADKYYDHVMQKSLAERVCDLDGSLMMSGVQAGGEQTATDLNSCAIWYLCLIMRRSRAIHMVKRCACSADGGSLCRPN